METRFTFFILTFLLFTTTAISQVPEAERNALIEFYNATDGPNWANSTNWNTAEIVDNWFGITVTDGHVVSLNLPFNELSGNIPTAIGVLTYLQFFSLPGNSMTGTIPTEIGNLIDLQTLQLQLNQISGEIPSVIGNLTNLTFLQFQNNQLTGSLPSELSNLINLTYLGFIGNQLTGSIPSELSNLTVLSELRLEGNQLSGSIPTELSNMTNLGYLGLTGNQLTGSIPPELGELSNLTQLNLESNQLSGSIPPELGDLSNLTDLQLLNNQLTGSIPTELGNLSNLTSLELRNNQLTGPIPSEIGNLLLLERLFVDNNQLSGVVPSEIGNLPALKFLYLSFNQFTDLPDFSTLTNLIGFPINSNSFTFEDIEPNVGLTGFEYTPQNQIPGPGPITLNLGDELNISILVGGSANEYQWFKDDVEIDGATTDNLLINNVTAVDAGIYNLRITNALAPDLTLSSEDIVVDIITGIRDESLNNAFKIYPVPVKNQLNIEMGNLPSGEYTLSILDLSGKAMFNEQLIINNSLQEHKVDVNALPVGIYMVIMQNESGMFVQKVVKE